MKATEIAKVLAQEFGTTDINELNKLLKSKTTPKTKYRCSGKKLGHGVTGPIKAITETGLKVIGVSRVSLVLFADIETFEKAKPRSERPVYPKVTALDKAKKALADDDDFDEDEDDEDFEDIVIDEAPRPKKARRRSPSPTGKSGSKFIPKDKK